MFDQFLNKKVTIQVWFGTIASRTGLNYKGTVTSADENFICLDNKTYILTKYVIAIKLD